VQHYGIVSQVLDCKGNHRYHNLVSHGAVPPPIKGKRSNTMGRLPTDYAGRKITFRIPFSMPGELVVDTGGVGVQFPEATFLHNSDKPFEIHRMIPRVTGMTVANVPMTTQPSFDLLERLMRIRVYDFSKNENLTKNAHLLSTITKGADERSWEWAEPYTLVRSEGFQVTVDNLATVAIVGGTYDKTRIELAFQGFLIVVAAPSERR